MNKVLILGLVVFVVIFGTAMSIAIPLIENTLELERNVIKKLNNVNDCEELEFRFGKLTFLPNERPILAELYQLSTGDETPTMIKAYDSRVKTLGCLKWLSESLVGQIILIAIAIFLATLVVLKVTGKLKPYCKTCGKPLDDKGAMSEIYCKKCFEDMIPK
jgi:hypothetical protein